MSDSTARKKPILAIIIAALLLISTPFIISNSVALLRDPLLKVKGFVAIKGIISNILPKEDSDAEIMVFFDIFLDNFKTEYSEKMGDLSSPMRKVEIYRVGFQLVIAIVTIFICIGLFRQRKWAHKFIIMRFLAALLIIVPLTQLSANHMNEVLVSSLNKSLYELPQLGGDERKIDIIRAIVKSKTKKQTNVPLIFGIVWNALLIGYFLHPKVRKSFSEEGIAQKNV